MDISDSESDGEVFFEDTTDRDNDSPTYNPMRRTTLYIPGVTTQGSLVQFLQEAADGNTVILSCENPTTTSSGCETESVILKAESGLDEAGELSVLLRQKCVIPVSFAETLETSQFRNDQTFADLPVVGLSASECSAAVLDGCKTFLELPVAGLSAECVTAELVDGCKTFVEVPVELQVGGVASGECVKVDLEGYKTFLELPLLGSAGGDCVKVDLENGKTFLELPVEVPIVGSSMDCQVVGELEGFKAEPEMTRGMSWLSDDQIEDMVRQRRHERRPQARTKRNPVKLWSRHMVADDEEMELGNGNDEMHTTVKLNTSLNRLTRFKILSPEELPSVVVDYPPPREPRKIIWSESLVREVELPPISSTVPLVPVTPRSILKREENKLYPFTDEEATPIVLTRKRVRKHKRRSED